MQPDAAACVQSLSEPEKLATPSDLSSLADPKIDVAAETIAGDEAAKPSAATNSFLGLRGSDQLFAGVLIGAAALLMLAHWVRLSDWGSQPVEIERHSSYRYEYRLDANEASWVEWANLQGIGETLARRIVAERKQHGPYVSVDDLQRVKGIGPKTIERLRPWILAPKTRGVDASLRNSATY